MRNDKPPADTRKSRGGTRRMAGIGSQFCVSALVFASLGAEAQQATTIAVAATSNPASLATATVGLGAPYKLVGGGARTTYAGAGSLLTNLQPGLAGGGTWIAAGKDHLVADPSTVTAVAVNLVDPGDQWEVAIWTSTTRVAAAHPVAAVYLQPGYALSGGGCTDNWQTGPGAPGNLLTASFPSSLISWECRGKDHGVAGPATITAYVIGIRPKQAGAPLPTVTITTATSGVGSHPEATAPAVPGAVVTGGGALALPADPAGWGQLLTASVPAAPAGSAQPNGWYASSKDHSVASPGTVTAFAVNLTFGAPATGLALAGPGPSSAQLPLAVIGPGTFRNPNSAPVIPTSVAFDGTGAGQSMVSVNPATTCVASTPIPPGGVCQVVLDLPPAACKADNYKVRPYVSTAAGTSYDAYIVRFSSVPTCPY